MAMLAGVTVTMTGCGSPSGPTEVDRTGEIANNHGHTVTITAAQQTAGGGVTLNIQGTGSHDHVLELTAWEVATIRGGLRLVKESGMMRNHIHTVTFN